MNNRSMLWLPVLAIGGLVLAVGVYLALHQEDPAPPSVGSLGIGTPGAIERWACPEGTVGDVVCGYVRVPADHDDPDSGSIRLFVATVGVPLEAEGPPLLVLGDRLGPATVDDFAVWRQVARDTGRDVVLLDHRGTGRSEPRLNCIDLAKTAWLEVDLGNDGAIAPARDARRQAVNRCARRLESLDDTAVFDLGSLITDVELIRQALAIEHWSILASGPTVPLALAVEADHPETVESMVLLRAAPVADDRFDQRQTYAAEALATALGCPAGTDLAACGAADPVVGTLLEAYEGLGDRSNVFTAPVGGARRRVSVNVGSVLPALALAVHDEGVRETLPALVERLVSDGQWREIAVLRGTQYPELEYGAMAVALATACELPAPTPAPFDAEVAVAGVEGADGASEAASDDAATTGGDGEGEDGDAATGDEATTDDTATGEAVDDEAATGDAGDAGPPWERRRGWLALLDDPLVDPGLCPPSASIDVDRAPAAPVLIVNQASDAAAPASAAEELGRRWPEATVAVLGDGDRPDIERECILMAVSEFLDTGSTLEGICA